MSLSDVVGVCELAGVTLVDAFFTVGIRAG